METGSIGENSPETTKKQKENVEKMRLEFESIPIDIKPEKYLISADRDARAKTTFEEREGMTEEPVMSLDETVLTTRFLQPDGKEKKNKSFVDMHGRSHESGLRKSVIDDLIKIEETLSPAGLHIYVDSSLRNSQEQSCRKAYTMRNAIMSKLFHSLHEELLHSFGDDGESGIKTTIETTKLTKVNIGSVMKVINEFIQDEKIMERIKTNQKTAKLFSLLMLIGYEEQSSSLQVELFESQKDLIDTIEDTEFRDLLLKGQKRGAKQGNENLFGRGLRTMEYLRAGGTEVIPEEKLFKQYIDDDEVSLMGDEIGKTKGSPSTNEVHGIGDFMKLMEGIEKVISANTEISKETGRVQLKELQAIFDFENRRFSDPFSPQESTPPHYTGGACDVEIWQDVVDEKGNPVMKTINKDDKSIMIPVRKRLVMRSQHIADQLSVSFDERSKIFTALSSSLGKSLPKNINLSDSKQRVKYLKETIQNIETISLDSFKLLVVLLDIDLPGEKTELVSHLVGKGGDDINKYIAQHPNLERTYDKKEINTSGDFDVAILELITTFEDKDIKNALLKNKVFQIGSDMSTRRLELYLLACKKQGVKPEENLYEFGSNRRFLYNLMTTTKEDGGLLDEPFVALPAEFWHFGKGDRSSGVVRDIPAYYNEEQTVRPYVGTSEYYNNGAMELKVLSGF